MAFRNVIVESPARISIKNEQLIIETDCPHTLATEDISALLLESQRSTVTTAALSKLGQCGCCVYVCDEKHMPCAVLTPFCRNSRAHGVIKTQLEVSSVVKKQLWKQIVTAKIRNQAIALRLTGQENAADGLEQMAKDVRSGDSGNLEAAAAHRYFPTMFGSGFTRSEDNGINSALNYGYAILRGCMARYISAYGLLPSLGIHHCSELNGFNLADDLMEPFRPVIDLLAAEYAEEAQPLTPPQKRILFNCLNLEIEVNKKKYTTAYAMELLVQSVLRAFRDGTAKAAVPTLLAPKQHSYE